MNYTFYRIAHFWKRKNYSNNAINWAVGNLLQDTESPQIRLFFNVKLVLITVELFSFPFFFYTKSWKYYMVRPKLFWLSNEENKIQSLCIDMLSDSDASSLHSTTEALEATLFLVHVLASLISNIHLSFYVSEWLYYTIDRKYHTPFIWYMKLPRNCNNNFMVTTISFTANSYFNSLLVFRLFLLNLLIVNTGGKLSKNHWSYENSLQVAQVNEKS